MAESHFAPHSNFEVRVVQLGTAPALSQVTAQLPSSTFTAVLGTSGSGKSILLALLAGRLDMESFEFDGVVSSQHTPGAEESVVLTARDLQHISAYVPPEDVVFGFDTPREAIVFRHRLLYGSTAEEAAEAAQGLLDEFGLTLCADNLIAPGVGLRGISGGQRRRTCIAMALATRPKLLLLDEPTTGLDSYTAKSVISGLQTVARKYGLVVVAALQQPGSDLFQYMDRVVQLTERGTCLTAGPVGESRVVTTYVEPLTLTADLVPGSAMLPPDERRAITLQQFSLVVQRHFRALLRNPASLGMRVAQTIFMSLFFGFIFFRLDLHPNNFKQIMGFLICYVTAHFMPVQTGAAVFPLEKDVFLEEQALPFRYPAVIYALSKTVVETVVAIPLGVMYAIIIGCLVDLSWDVIGNLCITTVLMTAAAEALGFMVSTIASPAIQWPGFQQWPTIQASKAKRSASHTWPPVAPIARAASTVGVVVMCHRLAWIRRSACRGDRTWRWPGSRRGQGRPSRRSRRRRRPCTRRRPGRSSRCRRCRAGNRGRPRNATGAAPRGRPRCRAGCWRRGSGIAGMWSRCHL